MPKKKKGTVGSRRMPGSLNTMLLDDMLKRDYEAAISPDPRPPVGPRPKTTKEKEKESIGNVARSLPMIFMAPKIVLPLLAKGIVKDIKETINTVEGSRPGSGNRPARVKINPPPKVEEETPMEIPLNSRPTNPLVMPWSYYNGPMPAKKKEKDFPTGLPPLIPGRGIGFASNRAFEHDMIKAKLRGNHELSGWRELDKERKRYAGALEQYKIDIAKEMKGINVEGKYDNRVYDQLANTMAQLTLNKARTRWHNVLKRYKRPISGKYANP